MEPDYRAISVIALIQAGVVVGGTLFVTAMLKAHGYGESALQEAFFTSEALFVRHYGFTLLLLPVAWASLAIFVVRSASPPWLPPAMFLLGIAAILFGIYGYAVLGLNPGIL